MSQVHQAPNLAQLVCIGHTQAAHAWPCRGQPSVVSQAPAGRVASAPALCRRHSAARLRASSPSAQRLCASACAPPPARLVSLASAPSTQRLGCVVALHGRVVTLCRDTVQQPPVPPSHNTTCVLRYKPPQPPAYCNTLPAYCNTLPGHNTVQCIAIHSCLKSFPSHNTLCVLQYKNPATCSPNKPKS